MAASTGGSYLFPPNEPMSISGLPVEVLVGIPTSSTHALVGDFSQIVQVWRPMPNGRG